MITNAEIKTIRSLREKKFRDTLGLFVVEGEKMVAEALSSSYEVVRVWRRDEIGENAMSRISLLSAPSPALALVKIPARTPESGATTPRKGLFLALDSIRDPGNMGTIIRLAEWFGVSGIFVSPDSVEIYNPKVIQATMGSIFRVEVTRTDIAALCRAWKESGIGVYGTFLDGENIYTTPLGAEALVVMGNESVGISASVADTVTGRLLIPSFGDSRGESLNVAVATAVTLSEFRRRAF